MVSATISISISIYGLIWYKEGRHRVCFVLDFRFGMTQVDDIDTRKASCYIFLWNLDSSFHE